jgi:Tol biopolymer transport system component
MHILLRSNEQVKNSNSLRIGWLAGWAWLTVCLLPAIAAAEEQASIESQCLSNLRQVTSGFQKAGEGYFSPDQQSIIYQAIPPGFPFYQIYTQKLAGGDLHRVSSGRGRTTCSYFAPDGKHVLFASSHLDPDVDATEAAAQKQQEEDRQAERRRRYQWDFDPHMDIFAADSAGTNVTRLTKAPGYDAEGAYSADGQWIAFCSDRDGDPDLYLMRSDGSDVRQLTDVDGYDGGPFISPDGRWIIYRSDRLKEGYLQIHAIGIDGQHDVALTDNDGVNWAPYWHPHEPYIIWAGADHSQPKARPNYDLWLMKYEVGEQGMRAGEVTRITDSPAADVLPVFSPDGQQLMWTSTRTEDHSSQLWIADFKLPE